MNRATMSSLLEPGHLSLSVALHCLMLCEALASRRTTLKGRTTIMNLGSELDLTLELCHLSLFNELFLNLLGQG
jgi:hypothetical protein